MENWKAKDNSFAELFRESRIEKEITLREISVGVGLSIGYLSDIEHKRRNPPSAETVKKIEEILEISDERLTKAAQREAEPKCKHCGKQLTNNLTDECYDCFDNKGRLPEREEISRQAQRIEELEAALKEAQALFAELYPNPVVGEGGKGEKVYFLYHKINEVLK